MSSVSTIHKVSQWERIVLATPTFYSSVMRTLAELVRDARARKKMTQEEMADHMGVERNWLAAVETGRIELPSPDRFELLERHLGVTREEMLRAAGYLGPEREADLFAVISRIAALDDLTDRIAALRSLPPPVFAVIEAMALAMVRQSLGRQVGESAEQPSRDDRP